MCNRELSQGEHTLWLLAALAAPVVHTAASCSWPAVAVVAALCLAISYGMEYFAVDAAPGKWLGALQWLWMLLVVSEFMHWIMNYWPVHENYHALPLILLALAAWTVGKGAKTASRAGIALGWPVLILLGVVLGSGIKEVAWTQLTPTWQMQTAYLITALLIPVMGAGYGKWTRKGLVLAGSLAVSVISAGVLSMEYVRKANAPFYELGRSIKILGAGQRFESLVAAGMTLGYFILLCYLLGITANAWEQGKTRTRSIWISGGFTALVFISGMRLNSRLLAVGNLAVWVLIPLAKNLINNCKKPLDKS